MRTFRVELALNPYPVHVGTGIISRLGELARDAGLKPGRAAILTDSNVARLYGDAVKRALADAGFAPVLIEVPAGEASKSLETLGFVYDRMTEAELDRQSVVFALGGGVPGDLGGFAAATYLRGIAVVHVPTTVVAQVDSALGGKTGINHRQAKNLIGAFHQPAMIVADVDTLATLAEREFREGMAEVIKYGAIMDADMIGALESGLDSIMRRETQKLAEVVERSLQHKAAVVQADEREGSTRKILNFGHTVGHALEASTAYGRYFHGEAVAIGMEAACRLSRRFAGLSDTDSQRLINLIARAGLPTQMEPDWDNEDFMRALRLDKKRADKGVEFVLIDRLGHALLKNLVIGDVVSALR